jgi:hypothetical protein
VTDIEPTTGLKQQYRVNWSSKKLTPFAGKYTISSCEMICVCEWWGRPGGGEQGGIVCTHSTSHVKTFHYPSEGSLKYFVFYVQIISPQKNSGSGTSNKQRPPSYHQRLPSHLIQRHLACAWKTVLSDYLGICQWLKGIYDSNVKQFRLCIVSSLLKQADFRNNHCPTLQLFCCGT